MRLLSSTALLLAKRPSCHQAGRKIKVKKKVKSNRGLFHRIKKRKKKGEHDSLPTKANTTIRYGCCVCDGNHNRRGVAEEEFRYDQRHRQLMMRGVRHDWMRSDANLIWMLSRYCVLHRMHTKRRRVWLDHSFVLPSFRTPCSFMLPCMCNKKKTLSGKRKKRKQKTECAKHHNVFVIVHH